jgi:putative FmdB family regulatory protein
MPLFEFTCRQCGRRFEALVTVTRPAECPGCGSADLEKLYSAFGTRSTGEHAPDAPSRSFG